MQILPKLWITLWKNRWANCELAANKLVEKGNFWTKQRILAVEYGVWMWSKIEKLRKFSLLWWKSFTD